MLGIANTGEDSSMPKMKSREGMTFGERLVSLREAAGYTQQELAAEVGVSRRMIAYYEGQSEHPPTTLLPVIAKTLGVSTDTLLGLAPPPKVRKAANTRLERRLKEIERLDLREKRQILQIVDTFLENQKLKRRMSNGTERAA
jgi:transcriptional regulator with XRE-family HTH domain